MIQTPWKEFICTSEKYPGKHILVIYDVNHDAYHDNYFEIKYAHQVDEINRFHVVGSVWG